MPSDTSTVAPAPSAGPAADGGSAAGPDLVARALEALAPQVDRFRSAVAAAEEEIRSYVTHRRGATEFRSEQALVELGPFALGRIDPERFGLLLGSAEELTPVAVGVLERAEEILAGFAVGREIHRASVESGGDLRDVVKATLDQVGQVFGASRAIELARSGRYDPDEHNSFLSHLAFRKWNRAERQLAPPVVVEVGSDDLFPAGLGEYLDGMVKVVLVVRGPTAPAPLARLITPGTYVVQTADPEELRGLAESPHPGVGLLFDAERPEQARFVHDPEAGVAPWQRITLGHLPERPDVGRGRRNPTWVEELDHLETLAREPAGGMAPPTGSSGDGAGGSMAASAGAPPEKATSADQLAAWLLSQTDLSGLEEEG